MYQPKYVTSVIAIRIYKLIQEIISKIYICYQTDLLSKSKSVKFSLIESVICIFTDLPVKRIFSTVESVNFH